MTTEFDNRRTKIIIVRWSLVGREKWRRRFWDYSIAMKRDQRIIIISLSILKNLGDCVYKTAAAAVIDGYTGAAAVASTTTTGCRCGACGDRCLQDKNIWPTGGRSTREIPVTSFHLNSNAYMRILPVFVCVCVWCVHRYNIIIIIIIVAVEDRTEIRPKIKNYYLRVYKTRINLIDFQVKLTVARSWGRREKLHINTRDTFVYSRRLVPIANVALHAQTVNEPNNPTVRLYVL